MDMNKMIKNLESKGLVKKADEKKSFKDILNLIFNFGSIHQEVRTQYVKGWSK